MCTHTHRASSAGLVATLTSFNIARNFSSAEKYSLSFQSFSFDIVGTKSVRFRCKDLSDQTLKSPPNRTQLAEGVLGVASVQFRCVFSANRCEVRGLIPPTGLKSPHAVKSSSDTCYTGPDGGRYRLVHCKTPDGFLLSSGSKLINVTDAWRCSWLYVSNSFYPTN
jgi:hypothetical protein